MAKHQTNGFLMIWKSSTHFKLEFSQRNVTYINSFCLGSGMEVLTLYQTAIYAEMLKSLNQRLYRVCSICQKCIQSRLNFKWVSIYCGSNEINLRDIRMDCRQVGVWIFITAQIGENSRTDVIRDNLISTGRRTHNETALFSFIKRKSKKKAPLSFKIQ